MNDEIRRVWKKNNHYAFFSVRIKKYERKRKRETRGIREEEEIVYISILLIKEATMKIKDFQKIHKFL